MARGLKQFLTMLIMTAFLGTSMAQAIPSTCALDMAMAGHAQSDNPAPCKDMSHGCQDVLGCVSTASFAMAEFSATPHAVLFWTASTYLVTDQLLEGRSIAPDLPVPILPA